MKNNLKILLYILLRDDITFGEINSILKNHIMYKGNTERKYSDNFLAAKAEGIIEFLDSSLTREEYEKFVLFSDNLEGE